MSYYLTNENSFLNINNAHLKVSGNVHADVMKIGAVEFAPIASNVTTTTNFTNVETGLTTSSNLHVGGTLTMGTVEVIATTHNLENTTTNGNITPHTVEFTNATTSIVASGNVEVEKELTVSGNVAVSGVVGTSETGALTVPSGTTAQQPSTGLVGGMIRFNSELNRLELYNGTLWQSIGGISAIQDTSSGTTTTIDGYRIHTFTSSGTFTVISSGEVEYLVVAGGGGGSNTLYCGGGGAGGMLTGTIPSLAHGIYNITVGSGGGTGTNGTVGNNSQFHTVIAYGGGGGGGANSVGGNGGSGGGGGYVGGGGAGQGRYGGSGTAGQGGTGGRGNGVNGYGWGGGGGGAGQAGITARSLVQPGNGGNGKQSSITGTETYYAGGAGGRIDTVGYSATGGSGGGGSGGSGSNNDGTEGGINTGGGGGPSKQGGSGIVVIRYLL